MNELSRTITGSVLITLGVILFIAGFFTMFFIWIYGIPLFILGIFILLNEKEDEIEGRKDKVEKIKLKGGKK